jgi:ferredoxin-type protein NapH
MARARRILSWALAHRLVGAGFLALLVLGRFDFFPWFRGSVSATALLDVVPFVDPLAALEVVLASGRVQADMLIGAGLILAGAVLLGPVFCGWVCPLGLLLDLNQALRRRVLGSRATDAHPRPSSRWLKYGVLGAVIGFSIVAGLPLFQVLSPISILVRAAVFTAGGGLLLVATIVIVEYVRPRLWCRSLCPLGALYAIVGRFGLLRVRLDPALAGRTPCERCTRSCPMGIRVLEDYGMTGRGSVDHPDCTRCGHCIDACPRGVLRLGFREFTSSDSRGAAACGAASTSVTIGMTDG